MVQSLVALETTPEIDNLFFIATHTRIFQCEQQQKTWLYCNIHTFYFILFQIFVQTPTHNVYMLFPFDLPSHPNLSTTIKSLTLYWSSYQTPSQGNEKGRKNIDNNTIIAGSPYDDFFSVVKKGCYQNTIHNSSSDSFFANGLQERVVINCILVLPFSKKMGTSHLKKYVSR